MNYLYVGFGSFVAGAIVSYLYAKRLLALAVAELGIVKDDLHGLNLSLQDAVKKLAGKV